MIRTRRDLGEGRHMVLRIKALPAPSPRRHAAPLEHQVIPRAAVVVGHEVVAHPAIAQRHGLALGEVAEFFTKCTGPYDFCDGIINQLFIFGDGFACDWVNDGGAEMLACPWYCMRCWARGIRLNAEC